MNNGNGRKSIGIRKVAAWWGAAIMMHIVTLYTLSKMKPEDAGAVFMWYIIGFAFITIVFFAVNVLSKKFTFDAVHQYSRKL